MFQLVQMGRGVGTLLLSALLEHHHSFNTNIYHFSMSKVPHFREHGFDSTKDLYKN